MLQHTNAGDRTKAIRQLNDQLRTTGSGGMTVVTDGIAGLSPDVARQVYAAVQVFTAFSPDNDPYGEHDCATLTVAGHSIIWKIDYYDRKREHGSPDPADPRVTTRVLTIMLASEY
jgi:hypothetical protein